jgi:hypothetical protein
MSINPHNTPGKRDNLIKKEGSTTSNVNAYPDFSLRESLRQKLKDSFRFMVSCISNDNIE